MNSAPYIREPETTRTYQNTTVIQNPMINPMIPYQRRSVDPVFIPRQHKVIISSNNRLNATDTHGNFSVRLQEPIREVIAARMLNCFVYDVDSDYSSGNASFTKPTDFLTLHIDNFGKNIGTTSGNGGYGDKLHDSFATIYYRGNTITPGDSALHQNTYDVNYDVKYFDPPLPALDILKVRMYDNAGQDTGSNFTVVFELLLETLEKVRVYR